MSSAEPQHERPRHAALVRRRRRHTWRNALLLVAGLLVLALVLVGVYIGQLASSFNDQRQTVEAGIAADAAGADGALNMLLLGSDSRGDGQDTSENKGEQGERSDTMMLVHIPADQQDVYVMSIIRDLWVEIPGHGERKVNAALGLGGYPLVTQTVENLVGVNIDHLAIVDFAGFNGLTTALGGVQLCNPNTFSAGQVNPSFFPRGMIHLEGTDALRFVRERQAFAGGDFERVENQQRFVSAVIDQLLAADTLANPQRLTNVVNNFAPYITTDASLDAGTIASYAWQLRDIDSEDVHLFTIPNDGPAQGPGGAAIIEQDEQAMMALGQALRQDRMDEFLEQDFSGDAGNSGAPEEGQQPDGGPSVPLPAPPTRGTPGEDASVPAPTAQALAVVRAATLEPAPGQPTEQPEQPTGEPAPVPPTEQPEQPTGEPTDQATGEPTDEPTVPDSAACAVG